MATKGGFGGGAWGGGPWGSAGADFIADLDGLEDVTVSEGLSVYVPLKLVSAVPLSLTLVELTFDRDLDPSYVAQFATSNFGINPPLAVFSTTFVSPRKIRLVTDFQSPVVYLLTVGTARTAEGDLLDPNFDEASFAGLPIAPTFFAAAQGPRKVMLTFSQPVVPNGALTNTANYSVKDLNGVNFPVLSVALQGTTNSHVTLTLGQDLTPWGYYVAQVTSPPIRTANDIPVSPDTDVFQWTRVNTGKTISIPISSFSGEVSGGLYGEPNGLVFFSPSLNAAVPNSVIQVDEVKACTQAWDEYTFPDIPDPQPFYLWSPQSTTSTLNNAGIVLWAPAERLGQARIELDDLRTETLGPITDGLFQITLNEPINTSRGGFLNDPRWTLFGGAETPFTIYDNLTPVPPGGHDTTIYPYELVQVPDTVQTVSSWVRPISEALVVSDTVGVETSNSTPGDSVSVTDGVTITLS